ncbi:ATP-binding protein [Streptomyces sp. NPDC056056]|uniref:ATP-binding protein n=1 Tax=Streptomyces sp. NPDC056056 TaxID=3345698 RepID=UPI0035DE86F4
MIISLYRKAPTSIPHVAGSRRPTLSCEDAERVQDVRRAARLDLARRGVGEEVRFVVELVVGELVANALQHQRCEALSVAAFVSAAGVQVNVVGDAPVPPTLWETRQTDGAAEDGRGLLLVAELTVERGVTGTGLWCVVPFADERLGDVA